MFYANRKRFKLGRATLALGETDGNQKTVMIPEGSVKVVSGPKNDDGLIDVLWRTLAMFEVDVNVRDTELAGKSAGA